MKTLIVANWKCNPQTLREAKRLFDSAKEGIKDAKNVKVVICPPFIYLPILRANGSQDCSWAKRGAYTGEISLRMLKDSGCKYVIVGHSERRKYFNETDEIINKKIKAVLAEKLTPILCVGETAKERKAGKIKKVLGRQLKRGLGSLFGPKSRIPNLIVAYEPVWAIGADNPCDIREAAKANAFIKRIIKNVPILYGGSVNSDNAAGYVKEAGFSGFLVGSASLNAKEFVLLLKNISKV